MGGFRRDEKPMVAVARMGWECFPWMKGPAAGKFYGIGWKLEMPIPHVTAAFVAGELEVKKYQFSFLIFQL